MTAYPIARPIAEPRGCLPTLAVLVIMVGIIASGAGALSVVAEAPPLPVEVSRGVTITPPDGWEFGGRSEDGNTVLISQGSGSVAISVVEGTDPVNALADLRNEWLATGTVTASHVEAYADDQPPYRNGQRFAYSGTFADLATPVEGEVIGFAGSGGMAVVFDAWAGMGEYVSVRDEITVIIRTTVIP